MDSSTHSTNYISQRGCAFLMAYCNDGSMKRAIGTLRHPIALRMPTLSMEVF